MCTPYFRLMFPNAKTMPFLFLLAFLSFDAGAATLPGSWDWRDVDGANYITSVKNMGPCGAEYIFAPVAMVEARYMIEMARQGIMLRNVDYSEQHIMSCGTGYFGDFDCNGGYCKDTLIHIHDHGVPTEFCYNYDAVDQACPDDCPDSANDMILSWPIDQISEHQPFWDETALMEEIYLHGPVATSMDVYPDFYDYTEGVYEHVYGLLIGRTAVTIVGWGDDDGSYWICKSNWSSNWGEDGYFRILRNSAHANCNFGEWVWTCTINSNSSPVGEAPLFNGSLSQNHPNPFNPQTTIAFEIPNQTLVSLRVFDVAGRLVRELMSAETYGQGRHEATWWGRNDAGRQMSSGTYFYRLEAGEFSETKRMILIK
ncbi:MAG: T9SS type A sorting domain-containing protein [Gemmatimonadales bacterium]|nr:T9SS type A sorting domain-containing protein [Gemmatimonadales bacterium]